MQHLMAGGKSLLIGDRVADLLLRWAALIGSSGTSDVARLRALDADGNEVDAGLLLNGGVTLVTETSHSTLAEPDNGDAERFLEDRIAAFDPAAPLGSAGSARR